MYPNLNRLKVSGRLKAISLCLVPLSLYFVHINEAQHDSHFGVIVDNKVSLD